MTQGRGVRGLVLVFAALVLVPAAVWGMDPATKAKNVAHLLSARAAAPAPATVAAVPNKGGPDDFGYTYVDSTAPNGPAFQWVDISQTGTALPWSDQDGAPNYMDDGQSDPVDIGFPFTFYGTPYTQLVVQTNGTLDFVGDHKRYYSTECLPLTDGYYGNLEDFIAPYWNDLVIYPGNVYVQTMGQPGSRRFVVMFDKVVYYEDWYYEDVTGTISFEVILNEADNSILVQYLSDGSQDTYFGDYDTYTTVGIQHDTDVALSYSCEEVAVTDGLAIEFVPPTVFLDDAGSSQVCLSKKTGAFQWSVLTGSGAPATFAGTLNVYNGGTMFWSPPGASQYVYIYNDPNNHTAWGYLYDYGTYTYSSLYDSNTLDDPVQCTLFD